MRSSTHGQSLDFHSPRLTYDYRSAKERREEIAARLFFKKMRLRRLQKLPRKREKQPSERSGHWTDTRYALEHRRDNYLQTKAEIRRDYQALVQRVLALD